MRLFFLFFFIFTFQSYFSQNASSDTERFKSFEKRKALIENSLVKDLPFENIGPTIMGGRVSDIEVDPINPTHFYVAYASGGLWETKNNGTTFSPIFDHEAVMSIGDIAIDWNNNIIYVGTGENNSSRSSYSGVGIYKSHNNGESWEHLGLTGSHHIGKIILHPTDQKVIWVAALGHLYSPNIERGIFKSTDAGKKWKKTLFIGNNCGAIDLAINLNDPDILYAAFWDRNRKAWDFSEGGELSSIHKSIDGGITWNKITGANSGFPNDNGVGRIGLSLWTDGEKEIVYAILDNQNRREKEDEDEDKGLAKEDFRTMSKEAFLVLEEKDLERFLKKNDFPEKYSAKEVIKMVKKDKITPMSIAEYLEDANRQLFDTPVIGAELYRSDDGGATWQRTHEEYLDAVVYSYGYYFGLVRVDPKDSDVVYIAGVPILRSEDGGKEFKTVNGSNVHVDHHALWVSPYLEGHLINGNDGGINISYDKGENWIKCNSPAVGQFYTIQIDMEEPYNVYGGLQDNGVWYGEHDYEWNSRWHQTGRYPYKSLMGGDGMQIMVDDRDPNIVYTGWQFGNYYRIEKNSMSSKYITPKHDLGERPLRWNWQSPIWLSKHNQDILYMGSNKFHRSMDRGETWEELSKDLTKGGRKGDVPYGTLTSIHESPLKFGLLYAGTDDGCVHVSKDGGNIWNDIGKRLPQDLWVSRIKASYHQRSRVYISLNGYRWDDFKPYLYVSNDYGSTWNVIGKDLPMEPINVVYEDPENEDLLYVGTDNGLYCSLNRGKNFMQMSEDLPAVAIHDLAVHPRENDLLVGTHGRSFYKANIKPLQLMHDSILQKQLHLFASEEVKHSGSWGSAWNKWLEPFEPETQLPIYCLKEGNATFTISLDSLELFSEQVELKKGLNFQKYGLNIHPEKMENYALLLQKIDENEELEIEKADNELVYLLPGLYTINISKGNNEASVELEIFEKDH